MENGDAVFKSPPGSFQLRRVECRVCHQPRWDDGTKCPNIWPKTKTPCESYQNPFLLDSKQKKRMEREIAAARQMTMQEASQVVRDRMRSSSPGRDREDPASAD